MLLTDCCTSLCLHLSVSCTRGHSCHIASLYMYVFFNLGILWTMSPCPFSYTKWITDSLYVQLIWKELPPNWSFQLHSYREEMLMAHYQQCHLQMQRIMTHVIPQYSFTNFFSLHPHAVKMPSLAGNYNLSYLSRWLSLWSSGLWSSYFKGNPECEGSWYFLTSVKVAISKVIFLLR